MIKSLEIEETKELIRQGIFSHKLEHEIKSKVNEAITIIDLLSMISNYDL